MTMDEETKFLEETLKLAKKGLSWTNPNPMVGAVIVKGGHIIGEGFHRRAGLAHGEIEALKNCRQNPAGSTLYINLEPCSHFGKTPPCTDVIIKSKVKRVVFCSLDPNPKVSGKGLAKLQKAGIETQYGILEDKARILNEAFFIYHEKRRPFVAVKFAASLDGKMATVTGSSRWITNEKARIYARKLRGQYQAVFVGINTILADNPNLGTRINGKKDPIRIILDPKLRIPKDANVLRDKNVILITTAKADKFKKKQLEKMGFTILVFNAEYINIQKLLSKLRGEGIISILVEGGGKTLGNFIDSKLVDKIYAFQAPIIIGGKGAVSIGGEGAETVQKALKLKNILLKKFGDNFLITGYVAD